MTMLAILTALFLVDSGSELKEILRDAQVTNKARLKQGHAVVELHYKPSRSKGDVEIIVQAEMEWLDERIRQRIRCFDPTGSVLRRVCDEPIERSTWDESILNGTELYVYNSSDLYASIVPNKRVTLSPLTYFHPWQAWLTCCPPSHAQGRPWLSMIDLGTDKGQELKSLVEVVREGSEHIKHTRHDPNGTVLEVWYSLKFGGQVVKVLSTGDNPRSSGMMKGSYSWKRLGDAYVLDECRFTRSLPGKPESIETDYHLVVKSVDLALVDPSRFSRSSFFGSLPPTVKVNDSIADRYYSAGSTRKIGAADLKPLANLSRSRGFGKPD